MSKLSFRARALDATKPMPVYWAHEIPDLPEFAAINRAVPQMPTGMEKEEESEHHLQRALSAQQVYGTAEALVIPVPDINDVGERYQNLYQLPKEYKPPRQYVHVQPWGMDQEIPDYDMDSEDEHWLNKQTKKMEVSPLKFENMMDRLEKGSGQTVVTLPEAKALLREDDDLTIAVYDYWLNKRLRLQHALIPTVKTEKRDGSTTNNPYVAFRRRTEKMQTRKNRKNDEVSYEKMLKLRRDLNRALTILELMKRREKSKKELLQLTIEVVDKRYQMQDWDGKALSEAMALRHKLPSLIPMQTNYGDWSRRETSYVRKPKREYKKRKHKQQPLYMSQPSQPPSVQLPQYNDVDILHGGDVYSSDDDILSPLLSASDHETDDDPDGVYAFRRKAGCHYHAPISDGVGNWPWCGHEEGGLGEGKYRYSLTSLSHPRRCVGFTRRRIGRGGRPILDRGFTPWDDYLTQIDSSIPPPPTGWVSNYISYVRENKIPHFRPRSPTEEAPPGSPTAVFPGGATSVEFNVESFESHREQLLQMLRAQQEESLREETDVAPGGSTALNLKHSFSSQPTSRFTLDSASAQFAASAVCNSTQELIQSVAVVAHPTGGTAAVGAVKVELGVETGAAIVPVPNGPKDSKTSGFSTSPAANVLQLNFPLATPLSSSSSSSSSPVKELSLSGNVTTAVAMDTCQSACSSNQGSISSTSRTQGGAVSLPSSAMPSSFSSPSFTLATKTVSSSPSVTASPSVAVSPSVTMSPSVVLKQTSLTPRNDSLPKENHEAVNNSLVKEKAMPMEVT